MDITLCVERFSTRYTHTGKLEVFDSFSLLVNDPTESNIPDSWYFDGYGDSMTLTEDDPIFSSLLEKLFFLLTPSERASMANINNDFFYRLNL